MDFIGYALGKLPYYPRSRQMPKFTRQASNKAVVRLTTALTNLLPIIIPTLLVLAVIRVGPSLLVMYSSNHDQKIPKSAQPTAMFLLAKFENATEPI
jgi:hypothetical protein